MGSNYRSEIKMFLIFRLVIFLFLGLSCQKMRPKVFPLLCGEVLILKV